MKSLNYLLLFLSISIVSSCIKDDFVEDTVEASIRITTILESIELNSEFQFEAMYLNNIGREEDVEFNWSSSDEDIASVSPSGLVKALNLGTAIIKVEYVEGDLIIEDAIELTVGQTTVTGGSSLNGNIMTTSSYALEGEFVFSQTTSGVNISFGEDYKASSALPGLFVYLSNNRNSIADALEIGEVKIFNGAHEYDVSEVEFNQYKFLVYFCKPFNVKVGDGELNF